MPATLDCPPNYNLNSNHACEDAEWVSCEIDFIAPPFKEEAFPSAEERRTLVQQLERQCQGAVRLEQPLEENLFLTMNRFKRQAARLRDQVERHSATVSSVEIESLLSQASQLRNLIADVLTHLVKANAQMYATPRFSIDDLVSEGSLALLRAIEKFDVARGYRFSTYATHAIRRSFFRYFQTEQRRQSRATCLEHAETLVDYREPPRAEIKRQNADLAIARMMGKLNERERLIIASRFGLDQTEKPRTLQSLADELGVCRERVRQLEQRALHRLGKLAAEYGLHDPGSISG